jgi:hypothetical protein
MTIAALHQQLIRNVKVHDHARASDKPDIKLDDNS